MSITVYRLDRWLANLGLGSRKQVKQMIRKGMVTVNGQEEKDPAAKVKETDQVLVGGMPLQLSKYVYYMMNKPQEVLSATEDAFEQTVIDLLPDSLWRPELFPAGRLDKDTEGFVLITNDGGFAHRLLSPKRRVPKIYFARLDKAFDEKQVAETFAAGMDLGQEEESSPAELRVLEMGDQPAVELTIYEGVYHQVKRMFAGVGLEVTYLKRIQMGGLALDPALDVGQTRELTPEEVQQIL